MDLSLFGKAAGSVFTLHGADENSAIYALGWVLSRSPALLALLGEDLIAKTIEIADARIDLQRQDKDRGFTDIEILSPSACHIIIEAKHFWDLPTLEQLEKYAARFKKEDGSTALLVSLSAASQEYADGILSDTIAGVALVHRSWGVGCEFLFLAFMQN